METITFGEHLMLDCYGADDVRLNSKDLVVRVLTELPGKLGMHPLAEPVVYFAEGTGEKDPGGWSGFVVIMESHISVHTFVGRGFLSADVYTCKNGMDQDFIVSYFKETFGCTDIEVNFVKRGTRYPAYNTRL
jgi:S-adenosylmethionine decarboxylase